MIEASPAVTQHPAPERRWPGERASSPHAGLGGGLLTASSSCRRARRAARRGRRTMIGSAHYLVPLPAGAVDRAQVLIGGMSAPAGARA
jgi:hypothetical protein